MEKIFLEKFEYNGVKPVYHEKELVFGDKNIPIKNGIPVFVESNDYVQGSFSLLREKHQILQLDSCNGTNHRLDTLLTRTQWPVEFFKNKLVLECGCGVGADTEVLVRLGCKVVAVDLTGSEIAQKNLNNNPNVLFVKGSILDLPFSRRSFDIVFCHRVIQHTPLPNETLRHILQFVKEDGAVFVHSYARSFVQLFRWKYFLRPITKRMNKEKLYNILVNNSSLLFKITSPLERFFIGKIINWVLIPFFNYRDSTVFKHKDDRFILEYGIHDTFDALSPSYDKPMKAMVMKRIASDVLKQPFEVKRYPTITLLRTKVGE